MEEKTSTYKIPKIPETQPDEYDGPIRVPLKWQQCFIFGLIALAGAVVVFILQNWIFAIQAFLFFGVLAYTAYVDIKLKLVSNWIHLIITGLALMNLILYIPYQYWFGLIEMGIGAVFVPLPLFIAAVASGGKVGGGDVKLMAACGLLLGVQRGFPALIIGLFFAIIINLILILSKKKNKKESFALVPYLAFGCMIAYFI